MEHPSPPHASRPRTPPLRPLPRVPTSRELVTVEVDIPDVGKKQIEFTLEAYRKLRRMQIEMGQGPSRAASHNHDYWTGARSTRVMSTLSPYEASTAAQFSESRPSEGFDYHLAHDHATTVNADRARLTQLLENADRLSEDDRLNALSLLTRPDVGEILKGQKRLVELVKMKWSSIASGSDAQGESLHHSHHQNQPDYGRGASIAAYRRRCA